VPHYFPLILTIWTFLSTYKTADIGTSQIKYRIGHKHAFIYVYNIGYLDAILCINNANLETPLYVPIIAAT